MAVLTIVIHGSESRVPFVPELIEATIPHTLENAAVMDYVEAVLSEITQGSAVTIIRTGQSRAETMTLPLIGRKRGGPAGTPEDRKITIVRGWLEVRGQMNQEVYAQSNGVAPSTLRRWMRELRDQGKL